MLLIHYSAYAPRLRAVLELPNRKLLLSHNVTPARWLWDHDPAIALQCELGRAQLPGVRRSLRRRRRRDARSTPPSWAPTS